MCQKCGTKSEIVMHCFPVEISFPVKAPKTGGILRRSGDISGNVVLDLSTVVPNNANKYWATCGNCNEKLNMDELFEAEKSTCVFCNNTQVEMCAYNEFYVCTECYIKYINYCSECPLKSNCSIYRRSREG